MILSHKLYDILSAWLEKAESERPGYSVACHGLCWWVHQHAPHGSAYIKELKFHFDDDGLDTTYPFEKGKGYIERENAYNTDGECHRNPRRLAWVKKKLKEYEDNTELRVTLVGLEGME